MTRLAAPSARGSPFRPLTSTGRTRWMRTAGAADTQSTSRFAGWNGAGKYQARRPVLRGKKGKVKTLLLDIETSPAIAMVYGTRDVYVSPQSILEPSRTVCFAAKWHGAKSTSFYAEWREGRGAMVRHAHTLLGQAD